MRDGLETARPGEPLRDGHKDIVAAGGKSGKVKGRARRKATRDFESRFSRHGEGFRLTGTRTSSVRERTAGGTREGVG